tara:strand:- start:56 stop:292 length:237 start_codon:yes stop_codon:yes gene_type:complete
MPSTHKMKTKKEIVQQVNELCLKDTLNDIESAIKSMTMVTSMGDSDKHEDRSKMLRVLSELNDQSRNIHEAIGKVNNA